MLTGKMRLAYGTSQTGGYHYFLHAVARQLQRYVRRQLGVASLSLGISVVAEAPTR
jgi:hypothetical protein